MILHPAPSLPSFPPRSTTRRLAFCLLALAPLHALGLAQPRPDPSPDPTTLLADGNPIPINHFGIIIRPPAGAVITSRRVEGRADEPPLTAIRLTDGLGTIVLQRRRPQRHDVTQIDLERSIALGLLGVDPLTTDPLRPIPTTTPRGSLITPFTQISTAGRATRIIYTDLAPGPDQPDPTRRGFAIIPDGTDAFLVFELITRADLADRSCRIFEHLLATAAPIDPTRADASIDEALSAGAEALLGLTQEDYQAVLAQIGQRLERIYHPGGGPGGADRELGYRRLSAVHGSRGDMTSRPPDAWRGADHQPGYALVIETRRFLDRDTRATNRTGVFLSPDRRREAWETGITIQLPPPPEPATRRRGRPPKAPPPQSWVEYASRDWDDLRVFIDPGGVDLSRLSEAIGRGPQDGAPEALPGERPRIASGVRSLRPDVRLEGYAARLEIELLPWLLARAGVDRPIALYAYDDLTESVQLLAVRFENEPGRRRMVTRSASGRTLFIDLDEAGLPLRLEQPNGAVHEPIDPAALQQLYASKGLPIEG